jgi:hypothetical protein
MSNLFIADSLRAFLLYSYPNHVETVGRRSAETKALCDVISRRGLRIPDEEDRSEADTPAPGPSSSSSSLSAR